MKLFFSKLQKREVLIFFVLFLLVLVLRLPTFQQPFENDSGAIAYHARLITRGLPLYGEHHPAHHMPGTYYLYAFAFDLLGDHVQSVRIILFLWTSLTVFLIYRLGKLVAEKKVGVIAALFSGVMLSHVFIAGANTRIESFVILPQVAAIYVLMIIIQNHHRPWKFFFIGFFSCIVLLFKVNYVSPIFLAALFILREAVSDWQKVEKWRLATIRMGWAFLGFCLPAISAILFFAKSGVLAGFLQVFTLGFSYTNVVQTDLASPIYIVLYPLAIFAQSNFILLISAIAGIIFFFLSFHKERPDKIQGKQARYKQGLMVYIVVWFCFSFIETGVSRTYLHNYYLVYIPSLTILSAWFFVKLANDVRRTVKGPSALLSRFILLSLTVACFVLGILSNYQYLYHYYTRYLPGIESYNSVLQAGLPTGVSQTMLALDEIGYYISAHTDKSDTIYYWSNFMELYYLADRRSSMDIIWPLYVDAFGSRDRVFEAEYILIGDMPLGYQETPEWLEEGLDANYNLETTLYDQQIYRRIH